MSLTEADKRVVRAFVNEQPADSRLLDTDGIKLDKMGLGGETVAKWVNGRIAIVSTESAKSDESIIRLISKESGPGVVDFSYARKGHRVHEHGAMGRNGSIDYPDQDAFIRELQSYFSPEVNERQVHYRMRQGALHVTYVNLPMGTGSAGGGAESQNNRMSFDIDGFPSTTYHAMWGGKLKIEQSTTFDRSRKLRAKTAPPSVIARYLADYLNKFAAEVPPRFTHTGGQKPNGRSTGILSDGTRVNAYQYGNEWTAAIHYPDGGYTSLTLSNLPRGMPEFDMHNAEGPHMGRRVPWDAVPANVQSRVEQAVVGDGAMVANPRKSARKPKVESREDRIRREWDDAEAKGLVRMVAEPEIESYFDVYGEPDSAEERQEIEERIDRDGVYMYAAQYLSQDTGDWKTADSIGMIFGDIDKEGYYEFDLKESALKNIFGGHTPNARGTTADANAVRELSLYIENDFALIGAPNSKGKSIDGNLRKKVAAGKYDPKLAPTLWGYLIEDGARKYAKEYATPGDWAQMFNAATRKQVAEDFARAWEAENLR